jgi:peptide/nickel transport system substrate-binding protein
LRVRQAIAMSINKQAIIDELLGGYAMPAVQMFPKGVVGHIDNYKDPYAYNVAGAKDLLRAAGKANPSFEAFFVPGGTPTNEAYQAQVAQAGINMVLTPKSNSIDVTSAFQAGVATAAGSAIVALPDPQMVATAAIFAGLSIGKYDTVAADLAQKATNIRDPKEREAAYQQLNRRVIENVDIVPIYYSQQAWAARPSLKRAERIPWTWMSAGADLRYLYKTKE